MVRQTTLLVSFSILVACNTGRPSDVDSNSLDADGPEAGAEAEAGEGEVGVPDHPHDCESADLQTNPYHCGECGASCIGKLGWGECVGGECGRSFESCSNEDAGLATCDAICEANGTTCAEWGCGGATAIQWPAGGEELCATGNSVESDPSQQGCSESIPWSDELGVVSCCCSPS